MARFRGTVQGSRGTVSRLGTKSSGLVVRANGWNIGVCAEVRQCPKCGGDRVSAYVTGGSNREGLNLNLPRSYSFEVCLGCETRGVDLTKPVKLDECSAGTPGCPKKVQAGLAGHTICWTPVTS